MRRDAAAVQARRDRAQARLRASQQPNPNKSPEPKYPVPDTPKAMIEFARSLGWEVIKTRDGYRFHHPSGDTASMHLSVSDKAAWRNLRSHLLRPVRSLARNGQSSSGSCIL